MHNPQLPNKAVRPAEPRQTIMVVEDEKLIRDFVCEMLHDEGFDTVDYETADEAWEAFGGGLHVNLLITDIRMPGEIDGAQLTHRVHREWPDLPIIVMSGHETKETADIAQELTFLPKPWGIATLTDMVMKAIVTQDAKLAR